jgi:hypothetical protein
VTPNTQLKDHYSPLFFARETAITIEEVGGLPPPRAYRNRKRYTPGWGRHRHLEYQKRLAQGAKLVLDADANLIGTAKTERVAIHLMVASDRAVLRNSPFHERVAEGDYEVHQLRGAYVVVTKGLGTPS